MNCEMIAVLERRLTFVTVMFIFDRTVSVRLLFILGTILQEAQEREKTSGAQGRLSISWTVFLALIFPTAIGIDRSTRILSSCVYS